MRCSAVCRAPRWRTTSGTSRSSGYTPSVLEKATAAEKPYRSVPELLADWGASDELRDVLLLPGQTGSAGSGVVYPAGT